MRPHRATPSRPTKIFAGVIAGIAVGIVGVTLVGAAMADSSNSPSDVPSVLAKSSAIAQASTIASPPSGSPSYTYISPTAPVATYVPPTSTGINHPGPGPQAAKAATMSNAMSTAVSLLSQYYNLMSVPSAVADRPTAIANGASNRATVVNATWAPSVASTQLSQLNSALAAIASDPTYSAFQSASIIVTGTQSETDNADGSVNLIFVGHAEYVNWDGSTSDDPDSQWQVNLAPAANGSLLLHDYGQVDLQ